MKLRLALIAALALLLLTGLPGGRELPSNPPRPLGLTGAPPPVALSLPQRLRAGVPAAIDVFLAGEPGATGELRLTGDAGVRETHPLTLDSEGRRHVAFRLIPSREGWHQWEASWEAGSPTGDLGSGESPVGSSRSPLAGDPAAGDPRASDPPTRFSAFDGLWVEPARPLRLLALGGTPDWEGRDALRALEEGGVDLEARFALGRGITIGDASDLASALTDRDVILLLSEAALPDAEVAALAQWVREEGGGLVLAGGAFSTSFRSALGLPPGEGEGRELSPDDWAFPDLPEITPLPPPSAAVSMRGPTPLELASSGRGRIAVLGIAESWRWRMDGELDAHRAFWNDLAVWAAGGIREPVTLLPDRRIVPVGERLALRVVSGNGEAVDSLQVTGEEGTQSMEARSLSFLVPLDTGVVLVEAFVADEPVARGWFRVVPVEAPGAAGPGGATESRALTVVSGGEGAAARDGGLIPGHPAEGGPTSPAASAPASEGADSEAAERAPGPPLLALIFAALLLVALADWTLRRWRGLG